MIFQNRSVKDEILVSLSAASEQRLRPHDMEKILSHRLGVSTHTIHQGVKDLVAEGKLVYTYRDPESYLEMAESIRSMGSPS